jgi:hypothetical protein
MNNIIRKGISQHKKRGEMRCGWMMETIRRGRDVAGFGLLLLLAARERERIREEGSAEVHG